MQPWISIATYNERENIEALLAGIHSHLPEGHVIVVDDNSPDGTGDLVEARSQVEPRVHVLHRAGKLGFASAHRAGMGYALEHGADVVLTMDADFSHDPAVLPALVGCVADGADLAIGSRYIPGGGTRNWPWHRQALSRGSNAMTRLLLGLRAHDCTGGFRAYKASLLRRIRLDQCESDGYSFQEESLLLCALAGARIAETPIIFEDRRAGSSKISRKVILEAVTLLFQLAWQRIFCRQALMHKYITDAPSSQQGGTPA
jgi:dolichol-phosphate mannosyltransferase